MKVKPAPSLMHVCQIQIALSRPRDVGGRSAGGSKRIIPIVGGKVEGARINGDVLNIGADWQTVMSDEIFEIDARYAIETLDGAIVEVVSLGLRVATSDVAQRLAAGDEVPADEYYMRTFIRLSSGHENYNWVNQRLFLASGEKRGTTVVLQIYEIE